MGDGMSDEEPTQEQEDEGAALLHAFIKRRQEEGDAKPNPLMPRQEDTSTPRYTFHENGQVSSRYIQVDGRVVFTTPSVNAPPPPTLARTITMNIHTFVSFFQTMRPRHRTIRLMHAGAVAAENIVTAGVEIAGHTLTRDDHLHLVRVLGQLEEFMHVWPDLEALVLEYTYIMLRNKQLTHEQAADDATVLLGKYISRDAWRMRVKKWAKLSGLPPVGQRQRKTD